MLHADRDALERPRTESTEHPRPCSGEQARRAGQIAAILAARDGSRDFARRFFLAMANRSQWEEKATLAALPPGTPTLLSGFRRTRGVTDPTGVIALFTDGVDNTSILAGDQVAKVAELSNTLVHVVSTDEPSAGAAGRDTARILREIAERSGGRFWNAGSAKDLRAAFAAIAASIGERYVLRYQPQDVKRAGWHPLAVKLRSVKGNVRARRGYWTAEAEGRGIE